MKINTLNTGRQYTSHGQRIAWAELLKTPEGALVGFYDADREVCNVVLVAGYPVDDAAVLNQYDLSNYVRGHWLPDGVEETLKAAALAHGQNK